MVESGTGTGSMTYSLSKAVGDSGKILSFEFNEERVKVATELFERLKVNNV